MKKLKEYSEKELKALDKHDLKKLIRHAVVKYPMGLHLMRKKELLEFAKKIKASK